MVGTCLGVSSLSDIILLFYCESPAAVHLVDNSTPAKDLQFLDSFVVCQRKLGRVSLGLWNAKRHRSTPKIDTHLHATKVLLRPPREIVAEVVRTE